MLACGMRGDGCEQGSDLNPRLTCIELTHERTLANNASGGLAGAVSTCRRTPCKSRAALPLRFYLLTYSRIGDGLDAQRSFRRP